MLLNIAANGNALGAKVIEPARAPLGYGVDGTIMDDFPVMSASLSLLVWFGLAWLAGIAAILGSLMTIGSVLLWWVPSQQAARSQPRPPADHAAVPSRPGQPRLRVLGFSLALAIAGFTLLALYPFPSL